MALLKRDSHQPFRTAANVATLVNVFTVAASVPALVAAFTVAHAAPEATPVATPQIVMPPVVNPLVKPNAEGQKPRAVAMLAPYRYDDILWENDRTAHRIYGRALEAYVREQKPDFDPGRQ